MSEKNFKELIQLFKSRRKDRTDYVRGRRKSVENKPSSVGEVLNSVFKNDAQALKRIQESRALLAWEELVGSAAARVSQALRVRNRKLIVKVTDPLWMQQLLLLKPQLLAKYRGLFPKLQLDDIFFTSGLTMHHTK